MKGAHFAGASSVVLFFGLIFATYTADNGFNVGVLIVLAIVALVVLPCGFLFTEWLARRGWGPYKNINKSQD